jgi:hypothetical protein
MKARGRKAAAELRGGRKPPTAAGLGPRGGVGEQGGSRAASSREEEESEEQSGTDERLPCLSGFSQGVF